MPVLFLDIDGVLVIPRTLEKRMGRARVADDYCVKQLNRVTESVAGCRIVLSSAWRFCGLSEMRLIFRHWGVTGWLVSTTPDLTEFDPATKLYRGVPRGREIQQWMDTHYTDTFAIVDDDGDMEHLSDRLVRTNFEVGLTVDDADRLIRLLREPMPALEPAR